MISLGKKLTKTLIFLVILVINYLCLWFAFSILGIENVQPIGFRDTFGLVFPPHWLLLVTAFLSLVEYITLTTFFPLSSKQNRLKFR